MGALQILPSIFRYEFNLNNSINSFGVFIAFFVFAVLWSRRKFYITSFKLPGPKSLPIIGSGLELIFYSEPIQLSNNLLKYKERYGDIYGLWLGPEFSIVLSEPEDLQSIFQSKQASNKGGRYKYIADVIGWGLLTDSGNRWKLHRHILNPCFSGANLKSFQVNHNRNSELYAEAIGKMCGKGMVEVSDECVTFAALVIIESLFFESLNEKEMKILLKALKVQRETARLIFERMCNPIKWIDFTYYSTKEGKLMEKNKIVLNKLSEQLTIPKFEEFIELEKNRRTLSKEDSIAFDFKNKGGVVTNAMIDAFLAGKMTIEEIVSETYNIILPGIDTMNTTMCFFILIMGMHKKCQDKAWKEIEEVFGDDIDGPVLHEHLSKLPYLEACFKEIARLFPTGPVQIRRIDEDFHLQHRNLWIPAGTTIFLSNFAAHRNPKYWDSPNLFIPERFLSDNNRPNYTYVPFSSGPRNCIGQIFGTDSMKTGAVHLLKNFEFYSPLKMDELEIVNDISVRNKTLYNVEITTRTRTNARKH